MTRRTRSLVVAVATAIALVPAIAFGSPAAHAAGPASSQLRGVSCVSATTCFAVGESLGTVIGQGKPLVERWNGKAWSIVAGPSPAGSRYASLYGVSCSSATSCVAVGFQIKSGATTNTTLVERWDGKAWSIVATPSPTTSVHDSVSLYGVSCASSTFCIATGYVFVGDSSGQFAGFKTLVEQWSGTKWSIVATPTPPGSVSARLEAVSCTSPAACIAVGDQNLNVRPPGSGAVGPVTLTERWDGKRWSVDPSPSPTIGNGATLLSVSCTSKTNCMAAGEYLEGDIGRPGLLTERWNGKAWSIPAGQAPSRAYSWLNGVSCAGPTSCMATGYYSRSQFNAKGSSTLAERWNGTSFSVVTAPNAAFYNTLDAVSCVSATSCVAVGHSATALVNANRTLVEQWDGAKWSTVPSPNPTA